MRVFIIILSILVFRQAVSGCLPSLEINISSTSGFSNQSDGKCTHKCCKALNQIKHKDNTGDNKKSSQDCDQKCKCGSCKVVSISPFSSISLDKKPIEIVGESENGIGAISEHGYDFHAKISYPPQG